MRISGIVPLNIILLLVLNSCGIKLGYRHFAEPIVPSSATLSQLEGDNQYVVGDDHSITFLQDRLEVSLLPLTAEILNRQFPSISDYPSGYAKANPYEVPYNPYTYGEWTPPGEEEAPARFTVFQLKVKNYAYPKVRVDPASIFITSPNGRQYQALTYSALVEYYWPYAVAYGGNSRANLAERRALIRRTLFSDEMIFSGQESEGYVVFTNLDYDVEEFTVWIEDMALRFDFKGEPGDTININYPFEREVYYANHRRSEER